MSVPDDVEVESAVISLPRRGKGKEKEGLVKPTLDLAGIYCWERRRHANEARISVRLADWMPLFHTRDIVGSSYAENRLEVQMGSADPSFNRRISPR
jgi:hypothetical protein